MLDFLDFLENRSLVSLQYLENGRFRQEIKKRIRRGQVLKAGQRTAGTGRCKRGSIHVRNLQRLNHVGYVILKSNVKLKR